MYQQNINPYAGPIPGQPNPQQMYGGYGMGAYPPPPMPGGSFFGYTGRPTPKATQPITPDLQKMLMQQSDALDIRISNRDKVANWCTHKEPGTSRIALVHIPESEEDKKKYGWGDPAAAGSLVQCRVCGARFHLLPHNPERVKIAAQTVIDYLQTVKTTYSNMPEDFLKAYSQTASMVDKLPALMDKAAKDFTIFEAYSGGLVQAQPGFNSFGAANSIMNGIDVFGGPGAGYGYMPYGPNPWMMQQQMNPQMAPQMSPNMGSVPNPQMMQWGAQMTNPTAGWMQPPAGQQAPMAPQMDQFGNVFTGQMAPGFNPLMGTNAPGQMQAPTVPQAAPVTAPAAAPATGEPTQTKQMTV